jgi:hypothetical protein
MFGARNVILGPRDSRRDSSGTKSYNAKAREDGWFEVEVTNIKTKEDINLKCK